MTNPEGSKFIDDLRMQVEDEAKAHEEYQLLAMRAETLRHPNAANTLYGIAADEKRHHDLLEQIIRTITSLSDMGESMQLHRLFPRTNADWADLGYDIKQKDSGLSKEVDSCLTSIYEGLANEDAAKRWLVMKAGDLGIT